MDIKTLREKLASLGVFWDGERTWIEDPRATMKRLAEALNPPPDPGVAHFFASPGEVDPHKIEPELELVETPLQRRILKHAMSFWSVPVTLGVGRRFAYLVWDRGHGRVMGIFNLACSVLGLAVRDRFIGWDPPTYRKRIRYIAAATILGAVPPYNDFLGAKLVALLVGADVVRETYRQKYGDELVLVETMGAFGKSAIYNRLQGWKFTGYTRGYAFQYMYHPEIRGELEAVLESEKVERIKQFSRKRFALVNRALKKIGVENPDALMACNIKRGHYVYPLAYNWREFLLGEADQPIYIPRPVETLVQHWKERWLAKRLP